MATPKKIYKINLPLLYSQFDALWANKTLGFNTDPKFNFYNYGCLISCLAMVAQYYNKSENPDSLNERLKAINGFQANSGIYVHGSLQRIYGDINEAVIPTPQLLSDAQMQDIKDALDQGYPVIFGIDYNPKTIAPDYHFVLVVDYNKDDENDFTICDPLGGRYHSLKDYLSWLKPSAKKTIEEYFIFRGQKPTPSEAPSTPVTSTITDTPEETRGQEVVEKPTNITPSGLPTNYTDIIHNSTEYEKVVDYLAIGKPPHQASFEDCKKVIAGYKSAKTDYDNKRIEAEKKAAEFEVTIKNQEEDIGRLKQTLLQTEKINKAEYDSLKSNTPNTDTLKKSYEGVLSEVNQSLAEKVEEVKQLRIQLAHKQVDMQEGIDEVTTETKSYVDSLNGILKRIFTIKW